MYFTPEFLISQVFKYKLLHFVIVCVNIKMYIYNRLVGDFMEKVCYVALSGGVDSAAAAVILKNRGYEVRGITLRLKPDNLADRDIGDAEKVASTLGIPITVIDAREDFKKVTDYFCKEYLNGRTPNPCVFCNPEIKFKKMLEYVENNGGDYLATGHYAYCEQDTDGKYIIRKNPTGKDQSYFLCRLNQNILSRVIFPLNDYGKDETRALAQGAGLSVAQKKDSLEVCFIPDNDYISFVEKQFKPEYMPGDFLSSDNTVLGKHGGIYKYTIGQRKGLGAFGKPMYVLSLNKEKNTVTIGDNAELFKSEINLSSLHFLKGSAPDGVFDCTIKIRCASRPAEATVYINGDIAKAVFKEPQRAAAPGQTAAFYSGDILLGGATIEK